MARVEIEGENVVVRLTRLEPVLALRRVIRVPLAHVTDVVVRPPEALSSPRDLGFTYRRGTSIPGLARAGSYFRPGEGWSFLLVFNPHRTIGIELTDEHFRRLVVQVDDEPPEDAAERIRMARRAHRTRDGRE